MNRKKQSGSAFSNSTGFELSWAIIIRGKIIYIEEEIDDYFREADYEYISAEKIKFLSKFIFAVLMIAAGLVSIYFSYSILQTFFSLGFAAIILLAAGIIFSSISRILAHSLADFYLTYFNSPVSQKAKQWHAAEHKVMGVLEGHYPATMEGLKNAPIFRSSCGTKSICCEITSYFSWLGLALIFIFLRGYSLPWSAILGLTWFLSLRLYFEYILFHFLQLRFFTANPTEEQLEASLKLVKRFKEKLDLGIKTASQ